jgi:hypothetical protein
MPTSEVTFNAGMELLLETVNELTEYLKKEFKIVGTTEIVFYSINNGMINGQSIKFSDKSKEGWTRACKFLLM